MVTLESNHARIGPEHAFPLKGVRMRTLSRPNGKRRPLALCAGCLGLRPKGADAETFNRRHDAGQ